MTSRPRRWTVRHRYGYWLLVSPGGWHVDTFTTLTAALNFAHSADARRLALNWPAS